MLREMKKLNRRSFLKASSLAGLAAAIGFPTIIPSRAFGANDKIVMAAIGTGGQGTHIMRGFLAPDTTQFVAVCDVDSNRRQAAADIVNQRYGNKDCRQYNDFRELLARRDIDAVTVTTPDHWHAIISIAAAKAGKHIYCEKPLANSIAESKAVRDAVRKYNVVLQTGSHERSRSNARYAAELVRNGYIGKLQTIYIQMPTVEEHHNRIRAFNKVPDTKPAIPDWLDYDLWLGHTPYIQYYPERLHHQWRFHLNFGAGEMSDRGAHVIDIGQLEAGRSIGFSYAQTMWYIILPQAFKNILPALGNEFIVLLKETSVSGYIALQDLTKGGDIIRSRTYDAFFPLIAVALIYLVMVMIFTKLVSMLERRLKQSER